ncbi:MAG: chromate efflux transporter [Nitrospirae bacterium]|nr:chromate efflux transporter [Nitrospirota bacterium]MBI3605565.1 chromate efflux transporter [Nitrospirota bacterium]
MGMTNSTIKPPTFYEAFLFWLKLGFISFGGPAGQIGIMHAELVERKRWISEERFLHALNYCMILPGPEAQQLAIYVGWLLHRTWGGIVAGTLFVIPSFFILTGLSWTYVNFGSVPVIAALFYGLKAAVVAIVASAVIRIGKKALKNQVMLFLAATAFVGLYFLKIPFPVIIISAGIIGLVGGKLWPEKFHVIKGEGAGKEKAVISDHRPPSAHEAPSLYGTLRVVAVSLFLWMAPLVLLALVAGTSSTLFQEGIFFSKAAMVTFGGAYSVLPYIAQAAVEKYHWLQPGQMIDGLGLGETTPGPLIMVVTFVGYVGAWAKTAGLSAPVSAFLGGLTATYFTFLPCFLWIFAGAPFIERTRGNIGLTSALSAITAAVVGVVLNLTVYFGMQVFSPRPGFFDGTAFVIAAVAFIGFLKFKWNILVVILGSAFTGICYKLFFFS